LQAVSLVLWAAEVFVERALAFDIRVFPLGQDFISSRMVQQHLVATGERILHEHCEIERGNFRLCNGRMDYAE
jgi:hypothetical protein